MINHFLLLLHLFLYFSVVPNQALEMFRNIFNLLVYNSNISYDDIDDDTYMWT